MKSKHATIITGGGRGIGRAIALRMSRNSSVFLVGRTESDLVSTCREIKDRGGTAQFLVGDISDPAVANQAVELVIASGLKIRNLVLNAGIARGNAAHKITRDDWLNTFAVNVHGNFWFVQACLPHMVAARKGYICFINSILGLKGRKYDALYSATKHAQVGLARSLGEEYAKHGIVTVPVCPHFVDTEMTRRMFPTIARHKGITEAEAESLIASQNPQGRIIAPEEVAEAVALICSGKVDSLNGQAMVLGGGVQ